jgi:drug/metabolite transporter (DMT)-like permease
VTPARRVVVEGNVASTASMLCWATVFPVTELLLQTWDPFLLAAARLTVAAGVALVLVALFGRPSELATAPWGTILPIGGLGLGTGVVLLTMGQAHADLVIVAIIGTAVPLVSAVFGVAQGRERIGPRLAAAILLAVLGGVIATGVFSTRVSFRGGELFAMVSVVLWTWYSRASVDRLAMLSDLTKSAANMAAGAAVVLPLAVLAATLGVVPARLDLGPASLGQLAWLGTVAVCLSMLLWLRAARLIGVTIAAMHQNMVPFYVMAMALAIGGRVETAQLVGGLLVVSGAVLAQWPAGRPLETVSRRRSG